MNALRLAAAAAGAIALAAALLGSSCSGPEIADCALPTLGETAADGGPDPCHCAPPPSLNIEACGCLSGPQGEIDAYRACILTYYQEQDAGFD